MPLFNFRITNKGEELDCHLYTQSVIDLRKEESRDEIYLVGVVSLRSNEWLSHSPEEYTNQKYDPALKQIPAWDLFTVYYDKAKSEVVIFYTLQHLIQVIEINMRLLTGFVTELIGSVLRSDASVESVEFRNRIHPLEILEESMTGPLDNFLNELADIQGWTYSRKAEQIEYQDETQYYYLMRTYGCYPYNVTYRLGRLREG